MFPSFKRDGRRFYVRLIQYHRRGGENRPAHGYQCLGPLGSVDEPISVSERIRFWLQLDARFRVIVARHPGCVTPADEESIRSALDKRIPLPRTLAERELFSQATVVRDAIDRFDENGDATIEEAARRLLALAREARAIERRSA